MNSTNRNAAATRGVPETDMLVGRVDRQNSLTTGSVQGHRGGVGPGSRANRMTREIVSPALLMRVG